MSADMAAFFAKLISESNSRTEAQERAYQHLMNTGLLSRVTLHRYICRRGCKVATVFAGLGTTLCAVTDYKYSPGMNRAQSVPSARAKNTLDGDRWWPSHVYDVEDLAAFGDDAGISFNCRHVRMHRAASQILADCKGAQPGRQNKPTILGASRP